MLSETLDRSYRSCLTLVYRSTEILLIRRYKAIRRLYRISFTIRYDTVIVIVQQKSGDANVDTIGDSIVDA